LKRVGRNIIFALSLDGEKKNCRDGEKERAEEGEESQQHTTEERGRKNVACRRKTDPGGKEKHDVGGKREEKERVFRMNLRREGKTTSSIPILGEEK